MCSYHHIFSCKWFLLKEVQKKSNLQYQVQNIDDVNFQQKICSPKCITLNADDNP